MCVEPALSSPVDGKPTFALAARLRCGILNPVYFVPVANPLLALMCRDCAHSEYYPFIGYWCEAFRTEATKARSKHGDCTPSAHSFETVTLLHHIERIEDLQKRLINAQSYIKSPIR